MIRIITGFCGLIAGILLWSSIYVVPEGKQAVLTQFGRPVRTATDPGIYFKIPFTQQATLLEKRILPWDGNAESMQTGDKKRIFIDVWARWKISDAQVFYQAVRTERAGQKILDDLVDSAVRDVVAQNNLIDVVRTSNVSLEIPGDEEIARMKATGGARKNDAQAARDVVTTGRANMEARILKSVRMDLNENNYGMELVDVHFKRVNYIESVKETVYGRMRSERFVIARLLESEAQEEGSKIQGAMLLELGTIEGDMKQQSAAIRGKADAEVIRLTAEAYGSTPQAIDFYQFLRQLDIYRQSFGAGTRLILSTESDLMRMLKKVEGVTVPDSPAKTP
ncbi:MAG: protease modulator HflC [Planctomycetota bacterium]|nr:protease modulator HflC [Planctomycetota bacterium]